MFTASTSKSRCSALHSRATPPCCGLTAFDKITQYHETGLGYCSLVSLVSVNTVQLMPKWRSPLAATINPAPRPLLLFQVAMEKVPLPPGREGANKTDIIVDNLLIELIINQTNNGQIGCANSRAFTKRTSRPPQPPTSMSGQGGECCLVVH
jgi:hypothetical protein